MVNWASVRTTVASALLGLLGVVRSDAVVLFATGDWSNPGVWDTGDVPDTTAEDATVSGGFTVTLDSAFSIRSLTQSSGTLTGSFDLTLNGDSTWSLGIQSGSGRTIVPNGVTLTLSDANSEGGKQFNGRPFENSGNIVVATDNRVDGGNGASVTNKNGAVFDIQKAVHFNGDSFGNAMSFDNQSGATLKKSAGGGTLSFELDLTQAGTLQSSSGTINLNRGGTHTGTNTTDGGATIHYNLGTHTLNGATLDGAGTHQVSTTLDVTGASSVQNLTFDSGTIQGAAVLTLNGTGTWNTGTMGGSSKTTIANGATLTLADANSEGGKNFDARTVENLGTMNISTDNRIDGRNGAVIDNSGTISVTKDQHFDGDSSGAVLIINNMSGATLEKTGGTGISSWELVLHNDGTVRVDTGTLLLNNGGTSTGTFTAAGGARIDYNLGTFNLNAGVLLDGAGTHEFSGTVNLNEAHNLDKATVNGGTTTLGAALSVTDFTQAGGTLTGSPDLTLKGDSTWSLGIQSGSGRTIVPNGVTLTLSDANTEGGKQFNGRPFENSGTIVVATDNRVDGGNAASIVNKSGAVFDIQKAVHFNGDSFGTAMTFDNQSGATLKKSAGGGTLSFELDLTQAGTLQSSSGTINLNRSGTHTGTNTTDGGATIHYNLGTHTLNGATLDGAGTHRVSTTLGVTGASSVQNLTFDSGTIQGGAVLTLNGSGTWNTGTMGGGSKTTIANGATLTLADIGSEGGKNFDTRTVENLGTLNISTDNRIDGRNGAVIDNSGTISVTKDQHFNGDISAAVLTINNMSGATLQKTGGTGISSWELVLHNEGEVRVDTGTLLLDDGGTSTGTFTAAGGAEIDYDSGIFNLNAGVLLNGAGTHEFSGTVNLNEAHNLDKATVNGGTTTLGAALSVTDFTQAGGTLTGSPDLTLNGDSTWSLGIQSGSGRTIVPNGVTLTLSDANTEGGKQFNGRPFENSGTIVVATDNRVDGGNAASIVNKGGAVFDIQKAVHFNGDSFGTAMTFDNQSGATLKKSAGGGTLSFDLDLTQTGTLQSSSGTINLNRSGTHTGTNTADGGATIHYNLGTHTLNGATLALDGAGTHQVSTTLDVTGASSVQNLTFDSGTIQGGAVLTLNGSGTWNTGTMGGDSKTTIANGATLTLADVGSEGGKNFDTRTVENLGTLNISTDNRIDGRNGAVIDNSGTINVTKDQHFNGDISGAGALLTINNMSGATLQKTGGAGISTWELVLNNEGTVRVDTGTLLLDDGGTSTGTFTAAGGAKIDYDSGTFNLNAGVLLNGAGTHEFSGTVNLNEAHNLDKATVNGGTTTLGAALSVTDFTQAGGTLTGSPDLTLNGDSTWSLGIQSGSGRTIIPNGVTLTLSDANTEGGKQFNGRPFENSGTIVVATDNRVDGGNAASIVNKNGAVFDMQKTFHFNGDSFGAAMTFDNQSGATLKKSAGGGTTTFDLDFNNDGTFQVSSGTVNFTRAFANPSGVVELSGGSISATQTISLTGGELRGDGSINGSVSSAGTIAPGMSAGEISISGNLTLQPGSLLDFGIGGLIQGTEYDFLTVAGSVALAGALQASLINGFGASINNSDAFTVLNSSTGLSGSFDSLNNGGFMNTMDGNWNFQVHYGSGSLFDPKSLVLNNFSIIPEPSEYALTGGILALAWMMVRGRKRQNRSIGNEFSCISGLPYSI